MSIIITPNETSLIEEFNKQGVEYQTQNLFVGDIHIVDNNIPIYIFERKAKNDLDASIKDHRYTEQKERLKQTGVNLKNIIYIIENLAITPQSKERVWSAICNTINRDGFTVFQTKSISETVLFLKKMLASYLKFKNVETAEIDTNISVNIKKQSVQPTEWFCYSLSLIPGCSKTIATKITSEFATLNQLKQQFQNNGPFALEKIQMTEKRKLGKKMSEKIYEYVKNF